MAWAAVSGRSVAFELLALVCGVCNAVGSGRMGGSWEFEAEGAETSSGGGADILVRQVTLAVFAINCPLSVVALTRC
jgi:hypothetical protein